MAYALVTKKMSCCFGVRKLLATKDEVYRALVIFAWME